jgi:hypothetical protein
VLALLAVLGAAVAAAPASAGPGSVLPGVTISYSCAGATVTSDVPARIVIMRKPYRGNYTVSKDVFGTSAFSPRPSYWSRVAWNVEVGGKFAGTGSVANCPVS